MGSRAVAAGIAAAVLSLLASRVAAAQACCGGASAVTPGWLGEQERALVGVQLRAMRPFASYRVVGPFFAPPPGDELRLDPTLFGSLRVLPRSQVSVSTSFAVQRRTRPSGAETGLGVADVALSARYDVLRPGESASLPGVAIVPSLTVPTGRPPDASRTLFATDVTGIGAWELGLAFIFERAFGHVALHGTGAAYWRAPRGVLGLPQQLGPRGVVLVGAGWVFDDGVAAWLSVSHSFELDAAVDGQRAQGTGRRATQASVIVMLPLSDAWRARGALFTDVPAGVLGENQLASVGLTGSLMRTFR